GGWAAARMVAEAAVPATGWGAGGALGLRPPVAEWMRERGHDLLGHGRRWTELWTLLRDEERAELRSAVETYERVLGARPLGWNSRAQPSEHDRTLLVRECGFLRHSDGSSAGGPCSLARL